MTLFLLLSFLCCLLLAGVAWLALRNRSLGQVVPRVLFVERELHKQAEHGSALGVVVKRHIQQSLAARQQVRHVQRQLDTLRSQVMHGKACDSAIAMVRKGKDIKPLVSRGELNSAEAHLIRLVHSGNPAGNRPKSTKH